MIFDFADASKINPVFIIADDRPNFKRKSRR